MSTARVIAITGPILSSLHPRVASERLGPDARHVLEPPGPMALNYGRWTPAATIVAHMVYGAILGWLYAHSV